jgi:hypothetical protein
MTEATDYDWAALVGDLVDGYGTLHAVAEHLAERRQFEEDVESVEKGLRRLRTKGSGSGGVWGDRVLSVFGLPGPVADRVRWMGQYHTRFVDLPATLAEDLLRPWDRPPVSESAARIWVLLGRVNLALRRRADPSALLEQARLTEGRAEPAARIEYALVESYATSRTDAERSASALTHARALLDTHAGDLSPDDHACLLARAIDQVAYHLNRPHTGPPDHAAAADLYRQIPADGPLFAQCRRANGLGWSLLKLGDAEGARREAERSVSAAGDAGSLRMRAMALSLMGQVLETLGDRPGAEARRTRADAIARHLEDEALALRFRRGRCPRL